MYLKSGRLNSRQLHDCVRETDTQGTAARRSGEKHAPAARRAWPEPGSARARKRHRPHLCQFDRARPARRVDRHCRPDRKGARGRAVEAAEGWVKEIRMKKPESEIRSASLHAKIRPRVKKTAEKMARNDDRSLAQWLEKMFQTEHVRREAKPQTR